MTEIVGRVINHWRAGFVDGQERLVINDDTVSLSGWGGVPRADCRLYAPTSEGDLRALLLKHSNLIARGNGKAYGDAALNADATVMMRQFNRILSFDDAEGVIVCEAGVLLSDILAITLPRSWFPPVVPGTKYVTVGGMIAADVHGKNHPHAGSFARHVCWIDIMTGDGTIVRCSPAEEVDLFEASLGGMGLTGIILRAALRLMRIGSHAIVQRTERCTGLAETFAAFEANQCSSYAVAWLDCLSRRRPYRAVVEFGEHASRDNSFALPKDRSRLRIPAGFPGVLANRAIVSMLNELHFTGARQGTRLVPLDRFFFPLDAISEWNRLYGRRGLIQFQLALPRNAALSQMETILERIRGARVAPLLAVLKRFGAGRGMLSFPMPGYTLALDFAFAQKTIAVLAALDDIITGFGGRIYLAKDTISKPTTVAISYPGFQRFRAVLQQFDSSRRFTSLLSRRLGL